MNGFEQVRRLQCHMLMKEYFVLLCLARTLRNFSYWLFLKIQIFTRRYVMLNLVFRHIFFRFTFFRYGDVTLYSLSS